MSCLTYQAYKIFKEKVKEEAKKIEKLEAKKDDSDSRKRIQSVFFEIDNPSKPN